MMINILPKRVHFMGIGGSACSGIALMAKHAGFEVSGCDIEKTTPYLSKVIKQNIKVEKGHDISHIAHSDLVVVSPAVLFTNKKHPEVKRAESEGKLMTWEEFVGKYLLKNKKVIGIAGTHGKSTITALSGLLFERAQLDPSVVLGAKVHEWDGNIRMGKGDIFLIEADEFNNNFLFYKPETAIINNIEFDHPDFFKSEDEVLNSFVNFVQSMKGNSRLIVNLDSPGIVKMAKKMGSAWNNLNTYGYTMNKAPELSVKNYLFGELIRKSENNTVFQVSSTSLKINREFSLSIPGEFNIYNSMGVIILGKLFNISEDYIGNTLIAYNGIGRRLELLGEFGGVKIYDDYAHHPTAIKLTLEALRQKYPHKKIWAIVEPHSFSRTNALLENYKGAFESADKVIITPIFKARDSSDFGISGQSIVTESDHKNIYCLSSFEKIATQVSSDADKGDIVVVMGAGKSYQLARDILKNLKTKSIN